MYFNCFETQVRPGPGGGGRFYLSSLIEVSSWADPEGETGKSQVIWVSIGNKQLDTTPLFWTATKKGIIPAAHVYALYREIPPPLPCGEGKRTMHGCRNFLQGGFRSV